MTVQRQSLTLGATTLALALTLSPRQASAATTKDQCVDANTKAQELRRTGELIDARAALRVCVADQCPKLVRVDCAKRLEELEAAMPSITFEAKDGAGRDLSSVVVTIDGAPFTDHLDGSAIDVNPGEHTFRFEASDQPPTTISFVIHEGEHGRRESITIGQPPPEIAKTPPPPAPVSSVPEASTTNPQHKLLALSLGGAGLVGIGIGAAFGVSASSHWSASKSECSSPSPCPNHAAAVADQHTATNHATVSTVAFIAGGAALAAGSVLLVLDWRKSREQVATLRLAPVITPSSAGLWVGGAL
ncbi:MAG TPA: hypothetical protein VGJ91_01270 [Polyangiaceae bacterium]